jgi:hypothetical protein
MPEASIKSVCAVCADFVLVYTLGPLNKTKLINHTAQLEKAFLQ